jgi:hypothetical protein
MESSTQQHWPAVVYMVKSPEKKVYCSNLPQSGTHLKISDSFFSNTAPLWLLKGEAGQGTTFNRKRPSVTFIDWLELYAFRIVP